MEAQQLSKPTRMAMMSQFLGFMLDAYDMGLVLVMEPILMKIFVSPKGCAAWQSNVGLRLAHRVHDRSHSVPSGAQHHPYDRFGYDVHQPVLFARNQGPAPGPGGTHRGRAWNSRTWPRIRWHWR